MGHRPRVVLAEDHPAMATALHELLASEFDVVEIVPDGAALIAAARRHLPDAIVCDIGMPGVSGLAAAREILATRPETPIVFVTIHDSRAVVRKALDAGAQGYVVKSDAGRELVPAVRAVVDGGRYLSARARLVLETGSRPADRDEIE
jgi:DNA-binding NarL/FixJ family response regulator